MTQNLKTAFVLFVFIAPLMLLSACVGSNGGYRGPVASRPVPPATQLPNDLDAPATVQDSPMTAQMAQNLPTVKVGILLPLSGQHQALGNAMLNAAQMALFDVGHSNLELIPRDTKGTPDGARAAAKSAVDSGAQLVLGPIFAASVRAAKPVTAGARVNMIAFSTDWTLAGGNTYIMGFLPFDQVARITSFAATHGIRSVGVISPQSPYGNVVNSAFESLAPRNGITIAKRTTYPPATANLAPVIRDFSAYDTRQGTTTPPPYDAVLMPVGGQEARSVASLLSHYGLPPRQVRRLGTGLFDEAALTTETNLEGAWFAAPSPNARKTFEQKYTATYGSRPQRISTLAYDATALAAVLARRGLQTNGRPAFDRMSLASPNGFSGIDGIFRFRSNNTAERGLAVLEIRRGQTAIIDEAPKTFQAMATQ